MRVSNFLSYASFFALSCWVAAPLMSPDDVKRFVLVVSTSSNRRDFLSGMHGTRHAMRLIPLRCPPPRHLLVQSTRSVRQGVRMVAVTNATEEEAWALTADNAHHLETYLHYPDEARVDGKKPCERWFVSPASCCVFIDCLMGADAKRPGDVRAALAPFLAHRYLVEYEWMLYGKGRLVAIIMTRCSSPAATRRRRHTLLPPRRPPPRPRPRPLAARRSDRQPVAEQDTPQPRGAALPALQAGQ